MCIYNIYVLHRYLQVVLLTHYISSRTIRCVCNTNIEYRSTAGDDQLCQKYNRYSDCFANIVCTTLAVRCYYIYIYIRVKYMSCVWLDTIIKMPRIKRYSRVGMSNNTLVGIRSVVQKSLRRPEFHIL